MATAPSTNSWLKAQRKGDLQNLAEKLNLKIPNGKLKSEIEATLDSYLADNAATLSSRSDLAGYYSSRSKALGSPLKRDSQSRRESIGEDVEKTLKVARRKASKAAEDMVNEVETGSTALVQTPGRTLSQQVARIPLPATPADVARAVDNSTVAVRNHVSSLYRDSGVGETTVAARDTISSVHALVLIVAATELFFIRPAVLPDVYAFTIPASVNIIGRADYPVYLPDMFALVSQFFWSPALVWFFTSFIVPTFAGFFFNLGATAPHSASAPGARTRARAAAQGPEYRVDPLTFSIAKALVSFLVYGQGVTFWGLLPETSIARLNGAVYGGYQGMLTGAAITGIASFYDAILKK
ncbi:uncharacterized protein F5Z01DRAFT_682805 [Emericellopsis atlantica]|uniref:Uncharacterized protein n=1 Tax=Emericellopsis atlantica TaxID=2614577 RepID=A0A9P7ZIA5_9HYPO|nr:uncharacterized protein F5Z01DRAFT_682805 [Emericellopsis atlantica]KAG9251988.1 hypothetical protein F5Z01DRAFT_682805 [Emericellopsis atlantica]